MNVFFTIDVETYTGDYERDVWGHGLGLTFLLAAFARHGVKATFFVEALGATRWGPQGVRRICRALQDGGHDVQLHLHPVAAAMDGFNDPTDTFCAHEEPVQLRLIRAGLRVLHDCGVENISAFRAGDFAADERTLRAMKAAGLFISANRDLDAKGSIQSRINNCFEVRNDLAECRGVVDLPLSCFKSPLPAWDGAYRHLQVTACGADELLEALRRMEACRYNCATVLTHPGEYFKETRAGRLLPDRKNQRRLEHILAAVGGNPAYKIRLVSECAEIPKMTGAPPDVTVPRALSVKRMAVQAVMRAWNRLR